MIVHCFVADLLGFSNLILNLPEDQQTRRVKQWIDLVKESARAANVDQFQLVSDTVFASASPDVDGLSKLVAFAQLLLQNGAKAALPIRGAITYGDVNWDEEVTFGTAIVEAYTLVNNQNWMGVTLPRGLESHKSLLDWGRLVVYPAPMKSGPIVQRPVVAWDIPPYHDFVKTFSAEGLAKEGEALDWSWGNKIQSTILFGIYLKLQQRHAQQLDPGRFHGFLLDNNDIAIEG